MTFDRTFVNFLIAGGINTLFGYGVYAALILLGIDPHASLLTANLAGILFNFLTTRTVFGAQGMRRLPHFIAAYGAIFAANAAFLWLALRMGLGPLIAQAVALPIFAILGCALMRQLVFAPDAESVP